MESQQKEHIKQHLVELIKQTRCSVILISRLISDKILGDDDKEKLENLPLYERSALLYDILPSRVNAYSKLILALEETNQTGALQILTQNHHGFPNYGLISFDREQELGRGLGTMVYKGKFDNREVAVKVIYSSLVEMERAVKEITILKKLDDHENIVRYYFAEVKENFIHIALELLLVSLQDNIRSQKIKLQPQEIIQKCTSGMLHLHSKSIIHGHLKPGNILLGLPNKVKLSDFGLSKQITDGRTSVSISGAVRGTDWMAPEILKATADTNEYLAIPGSQRPKLTTSSDIFSLGCIFYFVLSNGSHPFGEVPSRQHNVLHNILHLDHSLINHNWIDIMKRMISSNPKARPTVFEIYSNLFSLNFNFTLQSAAIQVPVISSSDNLVEPVNISDEPTNSTDKTAAYSSLDIKLNMSNVPRKCPKPTEISTNKLPEIHIEDLTVSETNPAKDCTVFHGNGKLKHNISEATDKEEPNMKITPTDFNEFFQKKSTKAIYESLKLNYQEKMTTLKQIGVELEEFEDILMSENFKKKPLNIPIEKNCSLILVHNTVPQLPNFYISRKLDYMKLKLNPEMFDNDCKDIFVFKVININIEELANELSGSSQHNTDISTRFIHLENMSDWKNLRLISTEPIHLIRCEKNTSVEKQIGRYGNLNFFLEQTSGDSSTILEFIEQMSEKDSIKIQEEDVITSLERGMSVVICSERGMGNSTILASLAHKIELNLNQIVVYFELSEFLENYRFLIEQDKFEFLNALTLVTRKVATNTLSESLLLNAAGKHKLTFTLFIEGFNKIRDQYVPLAFKFLRAIVSSRNDVKICITSTTSYQNELCKILRVTVPYRILPFDLNKQVEYIEFHLKHKISKNISFCLNSFKTSLSVELNRLKSNEALDIFGTPLMCNLFVDCYLETLDISKHVVTNKRLDAVELLHTNLLFKIIKRYLDTHILDDQYQSLGKEQSENDKLSNVPPYYVYSALDILLPEVATEYAMTYKINIPKLIRKYSISGSTRDVEFGNILEFSFCHKIVAEYILAEIIVDSIVAESVSSIDEMTISNFEKLMAAQKQGPINLFQPGHNKNSIQKREEHAVLYTFTNNTLLYFINYALSLKSEIVINSFLLKTFFNLIKIPQLYQMFVSLVQMGYTNLLKLLRDILRSPDHSVLEYENYLYQSVPLYSSYPSEYTDRCVLLTYIAAKYSDLNMVKECFNFFDNFLKNRLFLSSKNAPFSMKTPLHWAIKKYDLEMVKYLTNRVSLEGRCLLYTCIGKSYGSVQCNERDKIIEICTLLLEKNPALVHEQKLYYGISGVKQIYQGPIVADKVDLMLIKKLVEFGADIRSTYNVKNSNKNLVQRACQYMSETDFLELCYYLVHDQKALDLFKSSPKWNSPLHQIMCGGEISDAQKVLKCLKICSISSSELDEDGNNFIHCLVQGAPCESMLLELYGYGINPLACNNKGQNALHLSVIFKENKMYYPQVVEYLLSLGVSLIERDHQGRTPLEQAKRTLKEPYLAAYFQKEFENLDKIVFILKQHSQINRLASHN